MRSTSSTHAVLWSLMGAAIPVLFMCLMQVRSSYPYYFMFDMDMLTVHDLLQIREGTWPTNFSHPGSGMYLVLCPLYALALWFHPDLAQNLSNLGDSIIPLFPFVQSARVIQGFSVLGSLAIALFLMLGLSRSPTFKSIHWGLPLFLLAGWLPSLFYHSSQIRAEHYAVMLWVVSWALLQFGLHEKRTGRAAWCFVLSGLLGSLSLLAKIQVLLFFGLHGLAFWAYLLREFDREKSPAGGSLSRPMLRGLWLFSSVSVTVIMGLAWHFEPHEFLATYASGYKVTALALLVFGGTWLSGLLTFADRVSWLRDLKKLIPALQLFLAGFFLGFWSLLLLFPSQLKQGLLFVSYSAKILFFRITELGLGEGPDFLSSRFEYFHYLRWMWIPVLLLWILLVVGKPRWSWILWSCALVALCLVNMHLAVRLALRDSLLQEVLLFISAFSLLECILSQSAANHRWPMARWAPLVLAGFFIMHDVQAGRLMVKRLDAVYSDYGWSQAKWYDVTFAGYAVPYKKLMKDRVPADDPEARPLVSSIARDWKHYQRDIDFVFPAQSISARDVGVVYPGLPVSRSRPGPRIAGCSPELAGSILVDASNSPPEPHLLMDPPLVHTGEKSYFDFDYYKNTEGVKSVIAVLPRADLAVFLLSPSPVNLGPDVVQRTAYVDVQGSEGVQRMFAHEVTRYAHLPVTEISEGRFFLLTPRYIELSD